MRVPAALLKRFDIHPRRFSLLVDLFGQLGMRRELPMSGHQSLDLKFAEVLCFGVSALFGVLLSWLPLTATAYLTVFIVWTAFMLMMVLGPEIAYTLTNPTEALVLAHQPINGATYTAAKLTRLFGLFLRFGPKMNVIPALAAALFLKEARWFYPVNHMIGVTIMGLFVVLLCCSVFGLLIRFVPAGRVKTVIRAAQVLLILALVGFRVLTNVPQFARRYILPDWVPAILPAGLVLSDVIRAPARMFLLGHSVDSSSHPIVALAVALAMGGMLLFGICSFSVDYLIRVHSIVHGGSAGRVRWSRSRAGEMIARASGGQVSRAAFEYVRRMMIRDWEFMRRAVRLLPLMAGVVVLLLTGPSPFSSGYSAVHAVPHLLGAVFVWLSHLLAYGTEHKAMWVFLVLPGKAFRPFARGVHMSLWVPFVALPHVAAFVVHIWSWGAAETFAFTLFSAAVASLYLGLDLRRIEGIPFTRHTSSSSGIEMDQVMVLILRVLAAAVAIVIQYFFIFRSPVIAIGAGIVIGYIAYLTTRSSLNQFDISMRYHLSRLSSGSSLYEEVG